MRCPSCDALNADSAAWCTQCYTTLGGESGDQDAEPTPEPVEAAGADRTVTTAPPATDAARAADTQQDAGVRPADPTGPAGGDPSAGESAVEEAVDAEVVADGRFRRTPEGLDWRCEVCQTWNPIERTTCVSCGASFTRALRDEVGEPATPRYPEGLVVLSSALLPGIGHVLLGRRAAGLGRLGLYVVWAVGGVLLLREAAGSEQSVLPALPLLLGALGLALASVVDSMTLYRGGTREVLTARVLLWLTVGVVGATMLSFVVAAVTVAGTG